MIILEGCTIGKTLDNILKHYITLSFSELAEDRDLYCFQIIFHGPNDRKYVLSGDSQETIEKWMKA
jgi:hypothetical protein